jgi:cytochrome P450
MDVDPSKEAPALDFSSVEFLRDPYPVYARLAAARPVHRDARTGLWLLLRYDAVKRALTDAEAFSSTVAAGGQPARWLLFSDPPRHTHLRALISRAFTARAVSALEPRIRALSCHLLDALVGRERFDLVGEFSLPLPMMVIAELLGVPIEDWRMFRRWSDVVLGLISSVTGGAQAERDVHTFAAAAAEMRAYLAELLRARRARPSDDLLTRLIAAEVDGERLSDEDVLGFFQLLLVAGHETTTNLLGNAVSCMIEQPEVRDRVSRDDQLVPALVEEVLRYRSPVQAMFRVARREVVISGDVVPAGALVLPIIGAANRDPAQFVAPERFDLDRRPNAHLAFGHGIHFCVGAPLARLEAKIALSEWLARFDEFELDGEWQPRAAFHVHGPSALPLCVRARRQRS